MNCTFCGTLLSPDAAHCPVCNSPVQSTQNNPAQPQSYTMPPQLQGELLPLKIPGKLSSLLVYWHRVHCPYCGYDFHPSDCAVYSNNRIEQGKPVRLDAAPSPGLERTLARLRIKPLVGERYTREDARRACPQCAKLLPRRFEVNPTFTIAVIGDTASGKSHFLTTLFHQLKEDIAVERDDILFHFRPLSDDVSKSFKNFEQKMFINHEPLASTQFYTQKPGTNLVVWDPLIFGLEIGYKIKGEFRKIVMNLVFYDIAGEDITTETNLRRLGWPILRADGIIHVADPLSMRSIIDRLPPSGQVQEAKGVLHSRFNAERVLADVIRVYTENNQDAKEQQALTIPVAIMLSKSDLLDPIVSGLHLPSTRFLETPISNGRIDLDEMRTIDKEVRQLLADVGDQGLARQSLRFKTSQFFAASATGCAPDKNNRFPDVKPRRCLDPLLWLLWQLMRRETK